MRRTLATALGALALAAAGCGGDEEQQATTAPADTTAATRAETAAATGAATVTTPTGVITVPRRPVRPTTIGAGLGRVCQEARQEHPREGDPGTARGLRRYAASGRDRVEAILDRLGKLPDRDGGRALAIRDPLMAILDDYTEAERGDGLSGQRLRAAESRTTAALQSAGAPECAPVP